FDGDDGHDSEIFVKSVDGGPRHQVTHNRQVTGSPSWSPNGNRIAYLQTHGNRVDIYTIKVNGEEIRQVTDTRIEEDVLEWGRRPMTR
ncbi:MAG TPA: hypothetical protein VES21_14100, partial [Nocardioidaceae bacterium]|nr:hypothetical protein [Nocardioidaceae bacterium]